jgi:hypothetical protein
MNFIVAAKDGRSVLFTRTAHAAAVADHLTSGWGGRWIVVRVKNNPNQPRLLANATYG